MKIKLANQKNSRHNPKKTAQIHSRPISLSKTATSMAAHFNVPPVAVTVAARGFLSSKAFSPEKEWKKEKAYKFFVSSTHHNNERNQLLHT